jgi:hypothetical protein
VGRLGLEQLHVVGRHLERHVVGGLAVGRFAVGRFAVGRFAVERRYLVRFQLVLICGFSTIDR